MCVASHPKFDFFCELATCINPSVYQTHAHTHTLQLTGQAVLDECARKQLCMVSFLPHILDSGAEGRNGYIKSLLTLGDKYKQRSFE